jgi:thiamine-monophosphate kinase
MVVLLALGRRRAHATPALTRSGGPEDDHPMKISPDATLADTGELDLVRALTARFAQGAHVELGPGDDAAVLRTGDGRVVATTDLLVEGVHFRRDWSPARDVGHKAAAQNLADVAAMGARPTSLLVGLGAPGELPTAWALELADGLAAECASIGASIVGGDVIRSDRVVLAVTALGELDGRAPVTRAGARPGDLVAVDGRLGWAAAGLAVLSRGFKSPRVLVDAHRRPAPPYDSGPAAARAGATAMCDVSDGLLSDVGHIAAASGVAIDLDLGALVPDEPLLEIARAMSGDAQRWVLTGGEDHALAGCFPDLAAVAAAGLGWRVIGRVEAGEGVTVDGRHYAGDPGHRHFS